MDASTIKKAVTEFIREAAYALAPYSRSVMVDGCREGAPDNACIHAQIMAYALSHPGTRILPGWSIHTEGYLSGEARVVFSHCAVIVVGDKHHISPSTPRGESIRFLPDPFRPYEYNRGIGYNLAVFANHPLHSSRGPVIAPKTLAWSAPLGDEYLYSTEIERSRWMAFGSGDPFSFASEVGLNPESLFDLAMVSDVDHLLSTMNFQPKNFKDSEILSAVRRIQWIFGSNRCQKTSTEANSREFCTC